MKHTLLTTLALGCSLILSLCSSLKAQNEITISGTVTGAEKGEPLIGVNIAVKGKVAGTITDGQGAFSLTTKTVPPFTLIFSSVGYALKEVEITRGRNNLKVELEEEAILGQEIVIAASRYEESVLESPVSIEKLDILDIRNSPTADFYSGLGNLTGVDIGKQSLTFSTPNTRGFNDNTNYRINQLIDGVDNAAPGLNFAAGNIVGISPLDVESVELLIGASSALYGAGGLNGTILMRSKSPFEYQGLSASAQVGIMHLGADYQDNADGYYDFNVRYAKAFNDRFAFKVNLSYLTANDWQANDFRDFNDLDDPSLNRQSNPGYDGVNTYGDESFFPFNLGTLAPDIAAGYVVGLGFEPGTPEFDQEVARVVALFPEDQLVSRTGYLESDLADYGIESIKTSASLHYRISENVEAIVQGGYAQGTSVYTASNRFSLVDFKLYRAKAEIKGPKFFVRAWMVGENAGDSYDIGSLAITLNETWKPSEQWYNEYVGAFLFARDFQGQSLEQAYQTSRIVADGGRPAPGSESFNQLTEQIRTTPVTSGGAMVIDKSKMYNFEAMYDFSDFFKFADILAGVSHRIWNINSEGTIFADEPGDPHIIHQFGAYVQVTKRLINGKLKFTGSGRYDKNDNFEGRVTPRFSAVYSVDRDKKHNIRGSVQTAFRFPSIADQYTNLNVGLFRVIGGLPQFREPFNFQENPVYPLDDPNPLVGQPDLSNGPYEFPEFTAERVLSYEIGYKGLILENLLLDGYFYYNTFTGFIANQALGQPLPDGTTNFFLSAISTEEDVSAYGWAMSLDYRLKNGYNFSGNVSYNTLESVGDNFPDGFLTRFNSPNYRTNLSVSNRNVWKNIGFSVNWRWQNDFLWESTFGVGQIPAYHTVDAQVSYKIEKLKTIVKVGGSNIFNQYYTTGFGNPQIGGLYYINISFDEFLN